MSLSIKKITYPPETPEEVTFHYLHGQGGMCPYFAHVHFGNETVYAIAAPIEVLGFDYHDGAAFNSWIVDFVENRIIPRVREIGSGDRLIYVDVGPGGSVSEQIYPYVPVAETKIFDHDQALAFFYFPPMWVESKPIKPDGSIDFPKMSERVFNAVLSKSGLKIAVTRDGEFTVDFSDWMHSQVNSNGGRKLFR